MRRAHPEGAPFGCTLEKGYDTIRRKGGILMENFVYSIPTKIYFGKGQIKNLGQEVRKYADKVLLVYGGGSIKRNGIYDAVIDQLQEHGIAWEELSGVEPNPRLTTVEKGAAICKEKGIQAVLPIGGGSTLDCAKVVAAAARYEGNAWDLVLDPGKIKEVLPILSVLTLAATGSEMDTFAVITNEATQDKIGTGSPLMRPAVSFMDPEYTFSVSAYQTGAGTADMMSHIFEAYFSNTEGYMQDRIAEALLKTCIEYGVRAIKEPKDYEARANLMWVSSWAINDFISLGKPVAWTVHPMEHELSAYYDITHGAGLAILTPHWMRYVLNDDTVDKFCQYGVNVWSIGEKADKYAVANEAIDKTADYFKALGMPSTLTEVGIDDSLLPTMAKKAAARLKGAYMELSEDQVLEIFRKAL